MVKSRLCVRLCLCARSRGQYNTYTNNKLAKGSENSLKHVLKEILPLPLPPPADAAAAGKESAEISSADSPSSAQTPDISATVPADATVLPPSFIPAPLVAAVRHRDDAFTHPQPSAFARGADVIPS